MLLHKFVVGIVVMGVCLATVGCADKTNSGVQNLPSDMVVKNGAPFVIKQVTDVTKIAQLTGAKSINETDKWNVYGQDLGSMFNAGNKTYLVFGDTFGYRSPGMTGGGGEDWRSNTMAVTTDSDPSNGLTFNSYITDSQGEAKELLPSLKEDNVEMTKIPTNGVSVGNTLYL